MDHAAVNMAGSEIAANGIRVAKTILHSKSIHMSCSESPETKAGILDTIAGQFIERKDFAAAAACFLLIRKLGPAFRKNIDANAAAAAKVLSRMADSLFYDHGNSDAAADFLMLAAALDIENPQIHWEVIAPLIQGGRMLAKEALPYAILTAELNPNRNEVDYILGLTLAQEAREASSSGTPTAANWTTAGGNEGRTGSCAGTLWAPLEIAWKFDEAGFIQGGIAVSNGIAVFGDRRGVLFGVNIKDGTRRWKSNLGGILAGTPAIEEGRVYTGRGSRARCLDLQTGDLLWMWDDPERKQEGIEKLFASCSSVMILGQFVIFCDDHIAIFECETGKPLYYDSLIYDGWTHTGACRNGSHIFLPSGHRMRTLSVKHGTSSGTIDAEGKITAGPISFENKIVYGNNRGSIVAHDAGNGRKSWSFSIEGEVRRGIDVIVTSRPVWLQDRVIFGAGDGCCFAVDAETGEKIWKTEIGEVLCGPPLVVGDTVFVLSELSNLFALSTVYGSVVWKGAMGSATSVDNEMAFSDGFLLAGSTGLYAWKSKQ